MKSSLTWKDQKAFYKLTTSLLAPRNVKVSKSVKESAVMEISSKTKSWRKLLHRSPGHRSSAVGIILLSPVRHRFWLIMFTIVCLIQSSAPIKHAMKLKGQELLSVGCFVHTALGTFFLKPWSWLWYIWEIIKTIASIWLWNYARIFVLGFYLSSKLTVFLELRSRNR